MKTKRSGDQKKRREGEAPAEPKRGATPRLGGSLALPITDRTLEFDGYLEPTGPKGAWCFLAAPFDVEKTFGTRARVPIRGTINGFAFRSSFAPMSGRHLLCINKQMQAGAHVQPGDTARFVIERDDQPREATLPLALKRALSRNRAAKAAFAKLSFTAQKEYALSIGSAKQPETVERRLTKILSALDAG